MSRDCFGAVAEHLAEGFDRSDMRSPIRDPAGFKDDGHVGARAVGKITLASP
jgi:hypothetical protein